MQAAKDAIKRKLTIAKQTVELPQPFKEGQTLTLTAGTAHALNQVLFENLRNNTADQIKKEPTKAQTIAAEYFEKYEFGVRAAGGRETDPVRGEALRMAKASIRAAAKDKNMELTTAKINEMAEKLVNTNPTLMAKAKEVVDLRQSAGEVDLNKLAA